VQIVTVWVVTLGAGEDVEVQSPSQLQLQLQDFHNPVPWAGVARPSMAMSMIKLTNSAESRDLGCNPPAMMEAPCD